jgi:hypothetical protein
MKPLMRILARGHRGFAFFGRGRLAGGGEVAVEHLHHEAHLMVPSAWPDAARGDPTTCASSQARSTSGGGAL